jgi:hypothetical protein
MTLKEIKRVGNFEMTSPYIRNMCVNVMNNPAKVYEIIKDCGGEADTVSREAIFSYIADEFLNGDYDKIYEAWLA